MSGKEVKTGAPNARELALGDVKRRGSGPRLEELLRDLRTFVYGSAAAYSSPPSPGVRRNHLVDAYHHAWDCAVHLRQHIAEGQTCWPEYMRALDLVAVLWDRMGLEGVSAVGDGGPHPGEEEAKREALAHVVDAIRITRSRGESDAAVAQRWLESDNQDDWTPSDGIDPGAYHAEVRAELERIAADQATR